MTVNLQDLSARLQTVQDQTRQDDANSAARYFAGAVMGEVTNPLETLNNLIYLARHSPQDAAKVIRYMDLAQEQLLKLNEITKQTLYFCSEDPSTNPG